MKLKKVKKFGKGGQNKPKYNWSSNPNKPKEQVINSENYVFHGSDNQDLDSYLKGTQLLGDAISFINPLVGRVISAPGDLNDVVKNPKDIKNYITPFIPAVSKNGIAGAKTLSKVDRFNTFLTGATLFSDLPIEEKKNGGQEKTDYFDKKTGRSMGIYANGGGVNRYDVPAQMPTGQQFFQLPYNELATALMSKQKAYDTQEAEITKNQTFLADLKEGYRTSGLPQEIQDEYNTKLQNYINQDLTDPNVKRSLVQDLSKLKSDSRLRLLASDIKQSEMWDKYQQSHPAEAAASINPYIDKATGQWIPAKKDDKWISSQELGNWFGDIIPHSDYMPMINEAFSKVKENTKNKITESDPTASFYTGDDGKEYYLSKKTGSKAIEISPELEQWKAAAKEQAFLLSESKNPQARYFRGSFQDQISQNPNFISDFISTAGSKFTFKRTEESEDYSIKPLPGSSSGSGNKNESKDPTIAKYPLSVNTGQITDDKGNRITTVSQLSKVLETSLGEDKDGKSNYDKSIGNIVTELQTGFGKDYPTLKFSQFSPGSASIQVINTTGEEIPPEVQSKVDAINTTNELVLQKLSGLNDINKQIMAESGLEPNLTFEENFSKSDKENYERAKSDAIIKTLGGQDVGVLSDLKEFLADPTGIAKKVTLNVVLKQAEELFAKDPEKRRLFEKNFHENINRFVQDPKLKNYINNMKEVLNGIEIMNEGAIPIGESIKPGTKQETLMTVLNSALNDDVMLTDGKYIKYANKPDESLSDNDKKIVKDFLAKNQVTSTGTDKSNLDFLAKKTFLYFDSSENEYKLAINIPREDGKAPLVLEVGPKAVINLEQFASDVDSDYHNLRIQSNNKQFYDNLRETNGTFALAPKIDNNTKRTIARDLGVDESKINDYQIGVKRVMHPIQITQTSGETYNLTPGSFYFTVPEVENVIIKPKNAKSIFQFNEEYNKLKAKYGNNLSKSKVEELIQYINTGPGLGVEAIYSSKDYSRLKTYNKVSSPK